MPGWLAVGTDGYAPWRAAMARALAGPGGFYRRAGAPAAHFRTSPMASPAFAAAVATLARSLRAPAVTDVGAGGGELLAALAATPGSPRLLGVDLAPRPATLPARVRWQRRLPPALSGLVLANEYLDTLPVAVLDRGLVVMVNDAGQERLGPAAGARDAAWARRWWPAGRVEVGRDRDAAWARIVARLHRGVAVAVDYAVDPAHAPAGTLAGYVAGRRTPPRPDSRSDVTAHVHFASVAAAGAAAGAEWTLQLSQSQALRALGVTAALPPPGGEAAGYLAALAAASRAASLLDPAGLGGLTWLVQGRGCPVPAPLAGLACAA